MTVGLACFIVLSASFLSGILEKRRGARAIAQNSRRRSSSAPRLAAAPHDPWVTVKVSRSRGPIAETYEVAPPGTRQHWPLPR
jgi:hypothetical protein